jgi:hypothetical protein
MQKSVYDKRSFRNLPREVCTVEALLGDAVGPCTGLIHLHHSDPEDPSSKLVAVCAGHHPKLHALLRGLTMGTERSQTAWKPCPHPPGTHRYPGAREACERRLNRVAAA